MRYKFFWGKGEWNVILKMASQNVGDAKVAGLQNCFCALYLPVFCLFDWGSNSEWSVYARRDLYNEAAYKILKYLPKYVMILARYFCVSNKQNHISILYYREGIKRR